LEKLGKREPVSEKQLGLGKLSWTAFTATTPELMLELMQEYTSGFTIIAELTVPPF